MTKPGELEMLKAAGFKHIRMDFGWQATEKEKDVYDFSAYDRLTASLEKHGLKAFYILDYGNRIYEKDQSVRTEEGRIAFTKWAVAAVGHFKGRGICWEIWNEPNGGFWKPRADVNEYAALAMMASKAIKQAHPDEYLTGPATSTIDLAFLESCFKAGVLEYWDAVSVHPYRQGGPESVDGEYHSLRALISKYAPKVKSVSILSGEWGYSSVWTNHDADSQGRMLSRQWLINAANGIPISIWYDWHDDGPDPNEGEHHFGTVKLKYHEGRDPVYDPKPAYQAAKTFDGILKGYRFVKRLSLGHTEHQALLFEREGKQVLAAWSAAVGEHAVRLPSDQGEFVATGHLGESLPKLSAKEGELNFTVNPSPQYIQFDRPNQKLTAAMEALFIRMTIVPSSGREVIVKVENFSERAFNAKVSLDGGAQLSLDRKSVEISIPADGSVNDVVFGLKESPKGAYQIGANLEIDGSVVAAIPKRIFSPLDDSLLAGSRVNAEGDPKVAGAFTISTADAPERSPAGRGTVAKLDYDFGAGWKYAAVYPATKNAGRKIEMLDGAKPAALYFGVWIYGDSSTLTPRVRVKDAAGRIWQPGFPEIKWKGWKYVEGRLDENTAHWGGNENEKTRAPILPLTWDAPFLLDNPQRTAVKGTIFFTTPVVISE